MNDDITGSRGNADGVKPSSVPDVESNVLETESITHAEKDPSPRDDDDAASVADSARGDDLPDGYFWSPNFIGTWLSMVLGQISVFIYTLMATAILYTVINPDIGPDIMISWFSIGRTTMQAIGFILIGRLSDIFGRRWLFIIGNFMAFIGAVISATAVNVPQLAVGACITGFGEAVQNSFVVALAELVRNKDRPIVVSSVYAFAAPFTTFGPIISNTMIARGISWRWCFWLAAITAGLGTLLLFFCYHPPHYKQLHSSGRKTLKQQVRELDYLGIFLLIASLMLMLLPISWGGSMFPWDHAGTIAPLIIGVILFVALGLWEEFRKQSSPLIPMKLFRNKNFVCIVMMASAGVCNYFPSILLWPRQISNQYGITGQRAGWLACTVGGATSLGTSTAGVWVKLLGGRTKPILIVGCTCMVAFIASLAAQERDSLNLGIALTILGPYCVGTIESLALSLAPLFCPPQDLGVAAGLLGTIRSAVASIGTAIFVSVLQTRLGQTIPPTIIPVAEEAGWPSSNMSILVTAATNGEAALSAVPGMTPQVLQSVVEVLPDAYVSAFRTMYLCSLAFGAFAILGACWASSARPHLTATVSRKLQGKNPHITKSAEGNNA